MARKLVVRDFLGQKAIFIVEGLLVSDSPLCTVPWPNFWFAEWLATQDIDEIEKEAKAGGVNIE